MPSIAAAERKMFFHPGLAINSRSQSTGTGSPPPTIVRLYHLGSRPERPHLQSGAPFGPMRLLPGTSRLRTNYHFLQSLRHNCIRPPTRARKVKSLLARRRSLSWDINFFGSNLLTPHFGANLACGLTLQSSDPFPTQRLLYRKTSKQYLKLLTEYHLPRRLANSTLAHPSLLMRSFAGLGVAYTVTGLSFLVTKLDLSRNENAPLPGVRDDPEWLKWAFPGSDLNMVFHAHQCHQSHHPFEDPGDV
ncbi:hypothetical protein BDV93DRAFT_555758 [Ceratobasidium sp. AG-I]|nr:hypothetical protein BDV93DRAFT_555758 [Ceratobasidium sp. AG-I]